MAGAKDYWAPVDQGSRFTFHIWLLGILRLFVAHFSLDAHFLSDDFERGREECVYVCVYMCVLRGDWGRGWSGLSSSQVWHYFSNSWFFNQEKLDLCCINHQPPLI